MKINKNISPETIKAYLQGTLSHAQTHEFEKAMLNDAVLRDMVEGYEISRDKNVDFKKVNTSLSARLQNRVGEEQQEIYPLWKRVPLYARAASVLLFLGIGVYFLTKNNDTESIEKVASVQSSESKNQSQSASPIVAENELIAQKNSAISKEKMKAEMDKIVDSERAKVAKNDRRVEEKKVIISISEDRTSERGNTDKEVDMKSSEPIEIPDKEEVIASKPVQKPQPAAVYEPQSSQASAPAPVMKSEEVYAKSKAQSSNQNTDRIESQTSNIVILNEDSNKPVPNVTIISEDKTLGKTDEKGRFNLENARLGSKINLIAPNFENTEITVHKTDPDLFYIRPKSELIFIDLKRNKTWKYNPSEHPAQPSVSPDEYLEYLKINLKKPKQAIESQITGTVEVEFKVNKKGELSDFKIIKFLGYGCDEEAIRLIREGPKWLPKTYGGNTGRQRVRQVVNF